MIEPSDQLPFQQLMVACQAHRPTLFIQQHHPWTMAPCLTHAKCTISKRGSGVALGTASHVVAISNCIFLLHRPCYEWTRQRRRQRTLIRHELSISTDMRMELLLCHAQNPGSFTYQLIHDIFHYNESLFANGQNISSPMLYSLAKMDLLHF